jgi:hypothetical protein
MWFDFDSAGFVMMQPLRLEIKVRLSSVSVVPNPIVIITFDSFSSQALDLLFGWKDKFVQFVFSLTPFFGYI